MGCLKLNTEPEYNALKVVYGAASKSSRGSGKNEVETGYYYFGARYYDPRTSTWLSVDPLATQFPNMSPYNYCYGNPLKFVDPTGMKGESTHTDEKGKVIAVYNDGDNGVYRHMKNADGNSITKAQLDSRHQKSTSAGGERMGKTDYWDEFILPGSNTPAGQILFETSWADLINWGIKKGTSQDLSLTMEESKNGGILDIKVNKDWAPGDSKSGPMTGRLLNGRYATARSAGNYLAGYIGVSGTFQGQKLNGETYMKLAGAYQLRMLTPANAAKILILGKAFGPGPYYGEEDYSGRRIQQGINAAFPRP